ncbi:MAG: 50S ribosomal protein L11 methyltransferase [Limisphaerales bacterium]
MKAPPLWHLSVVTAPEAEDAVAELLARLTDVPASSYHHLESGVCTVSAYLVNPSFWPRAQTAALKDGLRRIAECGLEIAPERIAFRRVRAADWRESWKRHFKPIHVGRALLVRPGWSRERARPGQRVVVLDPGLSFGTGQHPTTAFCLAQLVRARRAGSAQSLLDAGMGSGLLAIAAAKLGYSPVDAFDFDPDSVRVATENARRNRLVGRIALRHADLTKLPRRPRRRYDVVCANLMAGLLLAERDRLLARVKPGGLLVLAGILREQFAEVRAAYEAAGLRLVAEQARKEWRSGAFRSRQAPSFNSQRPRPQPVVGT